MKCQNCGNELGQDEVFCGQCGTQNALPAQPTEMMQAPSPGNSLLGDGYRNRSGAFSPNQSNSPFPAENMPAPHQSMLRQAPQQSSGFYQDATQAVSLVPGTPANYPQSPYPQQGFNGGSMPGGYNNSGQFGTQQPFLTGNYSNPNFPPTQMGGYPAGQFGSGNYGSGTTAPAQKRNNVVMVVGIVCLVFAIITVGIFGAIFALRGGGNNQPAATPIVQATATPTPSPTPSPTPTPTPTATVAPTPAPDANFSWCTTCAQSGYMIEFPNGWSQGTTQDQQGTQFSDTSQTDIYAAVKTPSGGSSATDLLTADTTEFSSQPGYVGPQATQSATIGGTNWTYQTISYQANGQTEQVNIYATVNQGKGYIIELQAEAAQFSTIYTQYFTPMLTRFQFVAPAQ